MLDDVVKQSEQIEARLKQLSGPLDLPGKQKQIGELEAEAAKPNFWDDPAQAQAQMQRLGEIKETLAPWLAARKRLDDARTLAELAQLEDDPEAYSHGDRRGTCRPDAGVGPAGDPNAAFGRA